MNILYGFIDFEKTQKRSVISNDVMYDVKGYYKYLTFSELFDYYINNQILFR